VATVPAILKLHSFPSSHNARPCFGWRLTAEFAEDAEVPPRRIHFSL